MSIHEQARAEAEKRYDAPTGWGVADRDAFTKGYLAGHEAATRTRIVTTVDELDALADRTCIIDADMEFHQRHGSLLGRTVESAWLGLLSPTLRAASEIRLPARVLYEPQETR
jgi:hypothetical protein